MDTSVLVVWVLGWVVLGVQYANCEANSDPSTPHHHRNHYNRQRPYLDYIRKYSQAPDPPTDQCGILNQVQSSVIQIMNSHSEYGKGIHTLHNIADSLEEDISTLKGKITQLERKLDELNQIPRVPPSEPQQPKVAATLPPLYLKTNLALTRDMSHINHAVHNLTAYVNTQQEKFFSLEKKYKHVRRKLKAASQKIDQWNASKHGQASETTGHAESTAESGPILEHFMDNQKEINANLLQRMQYLEENWKRMRLQSDSPYGVQNNGCPPNFVRHFMSCYKFENITASWIDAEKHCQGLHSQAHLVAIETKEEGDFLVQYRVYNQESWRSAYLWTGGTDMTEENKWVWVGSRKPLGYTNWRGGQPDNHNSDQHCIYFRADGKDDRWDDWHCYAARLNFVCEINLKA